MAIAAGAALLIVGERACAQAPAEPADFSEVQDCATCPKLVLLPRGSFLMGVPPGEDEREFVLEYLRGRGQPQHPVTIQNRFYMGKYPVTRGEYAAFIAAKGERPDPGKCGALVTEKRDKAGEKPEISWRDPGFEQKPEPNLHPVVCVSYEDAEAYVYWLKNEVTGKDYRLPSEAEWEYAARAVTTELALSQARYWGDERDPACRYANVADATLASQMNIGSPSPDRFFTCGGETDKFAFTSPVGSFLPNKFGLADILGNVSQWAKDCWRRDYRGNGNDQPPADGSAWTAVGDCQQRAVRGGSWFHYPSTVRAGIREGNPARSRNSITGFRVARTY